ncbi:hypothetical protein Tco_0769652 [Tanacetum coccineum]|uniref:Uncharacterized protein n=1 Tax=Tanacetum coccineum TaxID=301880 RepID=A0ABQ4ZCL5_9ASTR
MTDTKTSSFESPLKVDKDWKEKFFYPANHVESVNQIEKPVKRTVRYADKSLVKDQESQEKNSFVEGCGSNTSKNVSEVEPKKVRKNNDALIIKDWVLDDEEQDGSKTKPEKKTVIPTATKIEKLVRKQRSQEVALFPTMLNVFEPSTSPSRITSSPSHSLEPSIDHSPDHTTAFVSFLSPTQPSPGAEQHIPIPNELPLHALFTYPDGSSSAAVTQLILRGSKYPDAEVQEKVCTETEPIIQKSESEIGQENKGKAILTEPEPKKKSKKDLNEERGRAKAMSEPSHPKKIDWNDPSGHKSKKKEISSQKKHQEVTAKKQKVEQDDEKEELKNYLDIVPREVAVDVEYLSTKQGVVELYRLVKERYSSSKPEGYDLMLWGDLHTLFELDEESKIWMNQNEYNMIKKKYPLSQEMISNMLSKRLEVDQESTQAYELLKFIRSQVKK